MNKLLVIGQIWPQVDKTAASYRLIQLIDLFADQGYQVVFCSAARMKGSVCPALQARNIPMKSISLNNDSFNDFLLLEQPNIVLFDRFHMEEQYGWRVRQVLPQALTLLDTEDLHFLRQARRAAVEQNVDVELGLGGETAIREISSINRVDVTIIISSYEAQLLVEHYELPAHRLLYLPFLVDENTIADGITRATSFESRRDFCTIGNLKHAPNVDAVVRLKNQLWPQIKKQLPHSNLFIYGAYASQAILDLHDPASGIFIKGHATSVDVVLSKHRVLLAPLRYGAGLKGKIFDAMKNGLPCVMSPTAAEGMFQSTETCGPITTTDADFVDRAVSLYQQPLQWEQYQRQGFAILKKDYEKSAFAKAFFHQLQRHNWEDLKARTFTERIAIYHADAHFKYLSTWIQEKNK